MAVKCDPGFHEFKAHFPKQISGEIVDYATNVALLHSRYIFTTRRSGIQFGYCTHCNQQYMAEVSLQEGKYASCQKCGSNCLVKASGRGRAHMQDEAYFIHYEKSVINPNAIIARGILVGRSYTEDFRKVETYYNCSHMYLFEMGNAEMYELSYGGYWSKRKSVISKFNTGMKYKQCFISRENLIAAVQNTPYRYSTWESYFDSGDAPDMVKFFELYAKYPCVEYLTKLGMHAIVTNKLVGAQTFGAINWRGNTIDKVLRLTKAEAKEWVKLPYRGGVRSLHSYHFFKKKRIALTFQEAHLVCEFTESYRLSDIDKLTRYASFEAIIRYFIKQLERKGKKKHYGNATNVMYDWRDYIKECLELGMDIEQDYILFPNDLHAAHQKTMNKVKIKRDTELNAKIASRLKGLQAYSFEYMGLFIRAALSSDELFQEGKVLKHCVGSYSAGYAAGERDLLVLRRSTAPDIPFFTMEIKDGRIVQCRGLKNCQSTPEVESFVAAFTKEKLANKQRKNQIKRPNERQEVAV